MASFEILEAIATLACLAAVGFSVMTMRKMSALQENLNGKEEIERLISKNVRSVVSSVYRDSSELKNRIAELEAENEELAARLKRVNKQYESFSKVFNKEEK